MRIVQVSTGVVRIPVVGYGGVERHISNLSLTLAKARTSVKIVDAAFEQGERADKLGDIQIYRVGGRGLRLIRGLANLGGFLGVVLLKLVEVIYSVQVLMYLRAELSNCDVIHFHSSLTGFILSIHPGVRRRSVYTIHSVLHSPEYTSRGAMAKFNVLIDLWLARRVSALITVNPAQRGVFIQRYRVSPSKVTFIPNGVNNMRLTAGSMEGIRSLLGFGTKFIVLHIARLSKEKGTDILVAAAKEVIAKMGPDSCKFVFVGPSSLSFREEVMTRVQELDLRDSIELMGPVSDQTVRELLSVADIFVLPSRVDAFDLSVLEAMSSGKPIVGTRLSGMSVQVIDGFNGILVDDAEPSVVAAAIMKIMTNSALKSRMAKNSEARSRDFSWDNTTRDVLAVYTRLTESAPISSNTSG